MVVIGFFRDLISQIGLLIGFITNPLGEQFEELSVIPYIKDLSIINLLGVGLVATLGVFLVIHLIRLFIGG